MYAEIVSPERILFEGEADMVVCKTTNGEIAFLERHEPFLALLIPGEVRIIKDNQEFAFDTSRGFVEVDGLHVRIISDDAVAK